MTNETVAVPVAIMQKLADLHIVVGHDLSGDPRSLNPRQQALRQEYTTKIGASKRHPGNCESTFADMTFREDFDSLAEDLRTRGFID